MCKIVFNISPLFLISVNLSSVSVFSFSHAFCLQLCSLFSAESRARAVMYLYLYFLCLSSAIKSICFWSRTGAAMYVCVYCVVRARLNLSRLEIIWKCSPSPLGTFHYLSRLSRFHTSTSNTVLIITKTKREIALLLISWNWEVFAGWFLILLCQPTAGFYCWVIADETWCPRNYVFNYQTSLPGHGMCGTGCPFEVSFWNRNKQRGLFTMKRQYTMILS